jgi:hypothetical protein
MVTRVNNTNFSQAALTSFNLMPKITSLVYPLGTTASTAGGQTITVNGTGFNTGVSVLINRSQVGIVSLVSYTQLTFITPALPAGTYTFHVVNTDGGWAMLFPGIVYA